MIIYTDKYESVMHQKYNNSQNNTNVNTVGFKI